MIQTKLFPGDWIYKEAFSDDWSELAAMLHVGHLTTSRNFQEPSPFRPTTLVTLIHCPLTGAGISLTMFSCT